MSEVTVNLTTLCYANARLSIEVNIKRLLTLINFLHKKLEVHGDKLRQSLATLTVKPKTKKLPS